MDSSAISTLVGIAVLVLLGFLIVRVIYQLVFKRKNRVERLKMRDIGTILDRSIMAYRHNLLPLLIVSALCVPLGNVSMQASGLLGFSWALFLFDGFEQHDTWIALLQIIIFTLILLGATGIGKTLLMCSAMHGMHAAGEGQTMKLADALPHKRLWAVVGMIALMILPSLLFTYLGLIGALIWMYWSLAPVIMFYESLGPYAACKRSYQMVRSQWSALLNTMVPLWLIGWLVIGTPLYGSLLALGFVYPSMPELIADLMFICWIIGSVFVAPLMALGSLQFYLYLREREQPASTFTYSDMTMAADLSSGR